MSTLTPEDFDLTLLEPGTSVRDFINQKINSFSDSDSKDAFFVADLGELVRKHLIWVHSMPRVKPFYAVKCNNSSKLVKMLAALGTGFDCASKFEMDLVTSFGVDPSRIIYANTVKQESHLQCAVAHGIQMMTFDTKRELDKIARCCVNAKLILRILPKPCVALHKMNKKFGVELKNCPAILDHAKKLGLDVIGISFHVGSGCEDSNGYKNAIEDARKAFNMGLERGFNMTVLDIGGGFPGFDMPGEFVFSEFAIAVNKALDDHFPEKSNVQVIAEPGRYYPCSTFKLAVHIIGKREDIVDPDFDPETPPLGEEVKTYYVNDGIHTTFWEVFFPHGIVLPSPHKDASPGKRTYPSIIYGQSCDGDDLIVEQYDLPELEVGDWLMFHNVGAYSITTSTAFNGFPKPGVDFVMSRIMWELFQGILAAKVVSPLAQGHPSLHQVPDGYAPGIPGHARKLYAQSAKKKACNIAEAEGGKLLG